MLNYYGHLELPVCDWMGGLDKNGRAVYISKMRLINIADINEVVPIPVDNVYPPAGVDRCAVHVSGQQLYCFLSYGEVCDMINKKIREFCG